jgi:hypothetical protein
MTPMKDKELKQTHDIALADRDCAFGRTAG